MNILNLFIIICSNIITATITYNLNNNKVVESSSSNNTDLKHNNTNSDIDALYDTLLEDKVVPIKLVENKDSSLDLLNLQDNLKENILNQKEEVNDIELIDLEIDCEEQFRSKVLDYIKSLNGVEGKYCNYYTINRGESDLNGVAINITVKFKNSMDITEYKTIVKKVKITWDRRPVIVLNGLDYVVLNLYEDYSDEGAVCLDREDGDISSLVEVEGVIDVDVVGTYYVKYSVVDSYGNIATKYRTVVVK